MKLNAQTPKFALNKAFLKQRPLRSEIEQFKANLKNLLAKVETKESEENKKNHVRDFLLDTYYKCESVVGINIEIIWVFSACFAPLREKVIFPQRRKERRERI